MFLLFVCFHLNHQTKQCWTQEGTLQLRTVLRKCSRCVSSLLLFFVIVLLSFFIHSSCSSVCARACGAVDRAQRAQRSPERAFSGCSKCRAREKSCRIRVSHLHHLHPHRAREKQPAPAALQITAQLQIVHKDFRRKAEMTRCIVNKTYF
jgi:hypothetical protein